MDNTYSTGFTNELPPEPARPAFLKVLCIITFVWSGILILIFLLGSLLLFMSGETAELVADRIAETNPGLAGVDPLELIREFGMLSLLNLLANIASLVGAILMWNLNRIGFFVYAVAEIGANFLGLSVNTGEEKSYGMLVFIILIDIAFIVMYGIHLKYMKKPAANTVS